MVGVLDDEGVGVGQVDARLNDGCAHQHVQLPVGHAAHHIVDGLLAHLAVGHPHRRVLPQHLSDAGGGAVNGLHPVVEVVHLSAPLQLPAHGVGQHRPVVLQHIGLHRQAVGGRLLQGGHIPDARHGHVQGAWNGGGGQGEHIHLGKALLQLLLVLDAEALLLVHHQQAQVLEPHIFVEQAVGADQDVHPPLLHPAQGLLHLGGGAEAGDYVDVHRILGKAAQGGEIVLPGQDGGGHQDGGLLAVQHAFHHGPEGHLRLAVPHVAAQKPVHGHRALHVPLDLPDAPQLVVGLGVFKLLLKLPLPWRVRRKSKARLTLALGVQLDQPLGQVGHRLFRLGLGPLPVRPPQLGQLFRLLGVLAAADILGDQVQLGGGDIQHIRPGVGDLYIVLLDAVGGHLHHPHIPAHSVVLVDHQVPGGQIRIGLQLLPVGGLLFDRAGPLSNAAGLALGDDCQLQPGVLHPPGQPPHSEEDLPRPGQGLQGEVHPGFYLLLPEEGLEVQGPLLAGHQHQDGKPGALIVAQVLHRSLQAGPEGGQLLGHQGQHTPGSRRIGGQGEGIQIRKGEVLQPAAQLVIGAGQRPAGPIQLAPLQQGLDVLLQLPLPGLGPLPHPAALREEDAGVIGEIVCRGGQLRID